MQTDQKKIKLLKAALKDEKNAREKLEEDLNTACQKNAALNVKIKEQEEKYIALY